MSEKRFEYLNLSAYRGEEVAPATVRIVRDFSLPMNETYRILVQIGEEVFKGQSFDAFGALEQARQQFEPSGWLLGIQGCSVRPRMSGMLRDSAGGMFMYEILPVPSAELPKTVSTFAPETFKSLVNIDDQSRVWNK